MPLLEEVGEGADEPSPGGEAESLKADHRRRRASKARKKKRAEVRGARTHTYGRMELSRVQRRRRSLRLRLPSALKAGASRARQSGEMLQVSTVLLPCPFSV